MGTTAVEHLKALPLFAGVSDDGLARVAAVATEFEAPAGRVLAEIGQPGNGMFVVEEGEVAVELPSGGEAVLGHGEFFGEMALLIDEPHSARVRAKTDVRCIALSRRDFSALLDEEPRVAVAMLPVLARRLRGAI
ncbi:MAG TPA: cyclic nucleotide-binding domain-containing protein [Actinomycetota bacterium]|nr:cyclic nucleotide-binding domain-containing protein [Actinomycetota bacterium]